MSRIRLAFFVALFTTIATYLLIMVGGLVHITGSSMACPDWPLCFGEALPKLEGGILYEHGHRYLASFVGFCSILLVGLLWRQDAGLRRPGLVKGLGLAVMIGLVVLIVPAIVFSDGYRDRFEQSGLAARLVEMNLAPLIAATLGGMLALALACLLAGVRRGQTPLSLRAIGLLTLVLLQGMLGGITVAYNLPDLVSTAHLGASMLVLVTLVFITRRTFELSWPARTGAGVAAEGARAKGAAALGGIWRVLLVMTILTFAQVVLGGLVRHTNSSAAAGVGQYFLVALDNGEATLWPSSAPARLNMLHRYAGFLVLGVLIAGAAWTWLRAAQAELRGRWALWLPPFVAIAQVLIGMGMLAMNLSDGMRLAHLGGGAALMAVMGYLLVWVSPMKVESAISPVPESRPKAAVGGVTARAAG